MTEPRITLITRQGCHLCVAAHEVVVQIADETGCGLRVLDVDTEPGLPDRYTDLVPVVLVDGAVHDTWRVDPDRLRASLGRGPAHSNSRWWHRLTGGR